MLTRSIGIAIAIICSVCLFGMVSSGQAFEITSLSASVPEDNGYGANVIAHLEADEDIICIR